MVDTLGPIAGALLSVQDVSIRFGGIVALDRVSFDVPEGAIVGLIGPNGAGKTTMFNCVTRIYRPNAGEILLDGRSLLRAAPHQVIGRGLARTFQNVELFSRMTVLDNVLCGLHSTVCRHPLHFLAAGVGLRGARAAERGARQRALEAMDMLGLTPLRDRPVSGLPYATQKAVGLARALARRPRLLLLDEPAGGLDHDEVGELSGLLRRIHRELGLTVLLVEHHMNLVMGISQRVVVLDFGRKIAEGTPQEVRQSQAVVEAYLGVEADGAA